MHAAAMTQPLTSPWRRLDRAATLRVTLERRAALVVEDHHTPVPRLDARVFIVDQVARLALLGADGRTLEQRQVAGDDPDAFAHRVLETVEWATTMHAGLAVEVVHEPVTMWRALCDAVRALAARVDEQVRRGDLPRPAEVALDRRRRVA